MENKEEVAFIVKIDRKGGEFEYLKNAMTEIEQLALEQFLLNYIDTTRRLRSEVMESEYFSDEDEKDGK